MVMSSPSYGPSYDSILSGARPTSVPFPGNFLPKVLARQIWADRQTTLWDSTRALPNSRHLKLLQLVCRAASNSHLQHRMYLRLPMDEGQLLEL